MNVILIKIIYAIKNVHLYKRYNEIVSGNQSDKIDIVEL